MKININLPPHLSYKWQQKGFSTETLAIIFLAPLLQTAWAEGFLQSAERREILRYAFEIGILPEDNSHRELEKWTNERPSDEFFEAADDILREWLESISKTERENYKKFIFKGCLDVARTSAEIGFSSRNTSPIRREEKHQLEKIGRNLGLSTKYKLETL